MMQSEATLRRRWISFQASKIIHMQIEQGLLREHSLCRASSINGWNTGHVWREWLSLIIILFCLEQGNNSLNALSSESHERIRERLATCFVDYSEHILTAA